LAIYGSVDLSNILYKIGLPEGDDREKDTSRIAILSRIEAVPSWLDRSNFNA
jgi:hypothetical protein